MNRLCMALTRLFLQVQKIPRHFGVYSRNFHAILRISPFLNVQINIKTLSTIICVMCETLALGEYAGLDFSFVWIRFKILMIKLVGSWHERLKEFHHRSHKGRRATPAFIVNYPPEFN